MGKKELSKSDRKALKAREAELEAALAAKAGDVTALKRKQLKRLIADKDNPKALRKVAKAELAARAEAAAEAPAEPVPQSTKADRDAAAPKAEPEAPLPDLGYFKNGALEAIVADEGNGDATRKAAKAELDKRAAPKAEPEADGAEPDEAEIKARVKTKNAARKLVAESESGELVDRDDEAAVKAHNEAVMALGGGKLLTSTRELNEAVASIAPDAEMPKASKRKADKAELVVELEGEHLAAPAKHEVEAVETGEGREFAAGTVDAFARPSEAPQEVTLEEGRNGYKVMVLKPDGTVDAKTVRQFTRATTYISGLEDTTNLTKWKMRVLLEGIALDTFTPEASVAYLSKVAAAGHERDVAIAKARKADRKGKLELGEFAGLEFEALKTYKGIVQAIADEALELGGVHAKAVKGTDLHALCQAYDASGLDVEEWAAAQEPALQPSDLASVNAYADAMARAGIKVLEAEVVVVDDALKVAGRADAIYMVKLPGTMRAVRVIGDIKTGNLEYGAGKIAQQLEKYAVSKRYDLATGERSDLKVSKSAGIVVHLPQGAGTCAIYIVDLKLGAKGNKLSGEVRAWRNEGKKAIDFTTDLSTAVTS